MAHCYYFVQMFSIFYAKSLWKQFCSTNWIEFSWGKCKLKGSQAPGAWSFVLKSCKSFPKPLGVPKRYSLLRMQIHMYTGRDVRKGLGNPNMSRWLYVGQCMRCPVIFIIYVAQLNVLPQELWHNMSKGNQPPRLQKKNKLAGFVYGLNETWIPFSDTIKKGIKCLYIKRDYYTKSYKI